jgi:hypothetical protein
MGFLSRWQKRLVFFNGLINFIKGGKQLHKTGAMRAKIFDSAQKNEESGDVF